MVKDVSYLGTDRSEKLDLYLPEDDEKSRRPAVLIVHGGGWHGGDKAAAREQNYRQHTRWCWLRLREHHLSVVSKE